MVSNYDRFSNCTAPTLNKSNYTSHSSQLNLYVDNAPVTPWVRGEVIHEGMIPIDKGYIPKNIFGRRYYGNNNNNDNNNNMKFYNPGTVHGDSCTVDESGNNHYQYYNRKRGRPYNRHYYHGGQRGYYNNNNNHNNHRSRYPFTCSPSVYPLSRSQSTYNIDYNTYTTTNTTNNNSNGRNHRYSNCGYLLNNEQPTDEYIDDCLLTDIEQYQLKLDINDNQKINQLNNIDKVKTTTTSSSPTQLSTSASTSSSTSSSSSSTNQSYQITDSHFYNEFKQLQYKSKSSLNLSTSSTIVYNINNKDEDDNHEDYTDVHDDIQDTVEHQMNSMESNNNNQEDGKSGNINDYLTLVWGKLGEKNHSFL
ncbi:unnamed protein product [Schistosoma rodhaini]|nr:unnamed protein product [Schistosoma rodhaini]